MSTEKRTRIEKEDKESRSKRWDSLRIGKKLYESGKINEAIDRLDEAYDPDYSPDKLNADIAYHLALCFIKFYDYDYADYWLKASVEDGSVEAGLKLASFYERGINNYGSNTSPLTSICKNDETALKYYKITAELHCAEAMYNCSEYYRLGKGVIRDYEESFLWLLKAACREQKYCLHLSKSFFDSTIVEKNVYEAYVWAVMAQDHCPSFWFSQLEDELDKSLYVPAQKEANKRVRNYGCFSSLFYMELFEYMTQEVLSKKVKPKEKTEPKTPSRPVSAPPPPIEEDEPEPTPNIAYKHVGVCKKRFNPEKVKIELVLKSALTKNQRVDFDSFKITYDGKHTDNKLRYVLNEKINYEHRRIMIALAAQNSESDLEQREYKIRKILLHPQHENPISNLNSLFRAMFPGCDINGKFKMIDRNGTVVYPQLKIDTTMIINAKNYDKWLNMGKGRYMEIK